MSFNSNVFSFWLYILLIIPMASASCSDSEDIDNTQSEKEKTENFTLSLTIELPSIGESRAESEWEKYEDYIDTSGLHILFFKDTQKVGHALKGSDIRLLRDFTTNDKIIFIPIEPSSSFSRKWNLRISIDNSGFDFIETIKNNDFKIAVLANWEGYKDDMILKAGDPIDMLHHLQEDDSYKDKPYFKLFAPDYKLGLKTDWASDDNEIKKGVTVGSEKLIPMYGVQGYKALGEYWVEGTDFDLSNFNNQTPSGYREHIKNISLLRSVAKVELLIPASMNPHHVYIRNMNRYSRNEPADVISDTGELWHGNAFGKCDEECEMIKLMGKKLFYDPVTSESDHFEETLSWYYERIVNDGIIEQSESPRILNPVIDSLDCVEFIKTEETESGYDRFILYVPEKFVDDPLTSDLSIPKLCHIEFRDKYDLRDDIDINDNNSYRLYFPEGGIVKEAELPRFNDSDDTWEKVYEQKEDVLKLHWPILRNHLYRFKVKE